MHQSKMAARNVSRTTSSLFSPSQALRNPGGIACNPQRGSCLPRSFAVKVPFGPSGSRTIPIEPKEVGDALASGAQGLVETAEAVPRTLVSKPETYAEDRVTGRKLAGSILPPPPIPGIRRAPRELAGPTMEGMKGRMAIRLPEEGTRFRKYIDPRADFFFPVTATFVGIWPLYMFCKTFL